MDTTLDIIKGRVRTVSALTLPVPTRANAEYQTRNWGQEFESLRARSVCHFPCDSNGIRTAIQIPKGQILFAHPTFHRESMVHAHRQRILISPFPGSNPGAPATQSRLYVDFHMSKMFAVFPDVSV